MSDILAVDPGTTESAWCEFRDGIPQFWAKQPNAMLLHRLREQDPAGLLCIEQIASMGMAVGQEVFDTVEWAGRFREAWESRGGQVRMVRRREVKMHLCGNNAAKDSNIRQALIDQFGGKAVAIGKKASPGPLLGLSGDCWSALAIAVTAAGTSAPAAILTP